MDRAFDGVANASKLSISVLTSFTLEIFTQPSLHRFVQKSEDSVKIYNVKVVNTEMAELCQNQKSLWILYSPGRCAAGWANLYLKTNVFFLEHLIVHLPFEGYLPLMFVGWTRPDLQTMPGLAQLSNRVSDQAAINDN